MDWISQKVNDGIFGTVSKILTDFLAWAFKLMMELIVNLSDLKAYFDYSQYLFYAQIIAGSLLVLAIVFEVVKSMSGNIFSGSEEASLSTYTGRVVIGGMLIYFLPWSVQNIFMAFNNALIGLINSIPMKYEFNSLDALMMVLKRGFGDASWAFLLVSLIIVLGFMMIGVMAAIRYVELILTIIFAPFAAISFVRKGDSLSVWLRETASITLTQCIQVLLIKILATIIGTVIDPIVLPLLVIGVLAVMVRGPNIIRKFLYATGTGSSTVSTLGESGRMEAMKFMLMK